MLVAQFKHIYEHTPLVGVRGLLGTLHHFGEMCLFASLLTSRLTLSKNTKKGLSQKCEIIPLSIGP